MYIYYCQKCNEFEAFKSKTGVFRCPDCGEEYVPLEVTVDEWNNYSNDEMLDAIKNAKQPVAIKQPVFDNPSSNQIEVYRTPTTPKRDNRKRSPSFTRNIIIICSILALIVVGTVLGVIFKGSGKSQYYLGFEWGTPRSEIEAKYPGGDVPDSGGYTFVNEKDRLFDIKGVEEMPSFNFDDDNRLCKTIIFLTDNGNQYTSEYIYDFVTDVFEKNGFEQYEDENARVFHAERMFKNKDTKVSFMALISEDYGTMYSTIMEPIQ